MEFITDRSREDVILENSKGSYGAEDLNRVEENVKLLMQAVETMGDICPGLRVKTDWNLPEVFSPEEWPVKSQMERYLENVKILCQAYGLLPQLPSSMEHLTWEGANQIEQALKELDQMIHNTQLAASRCGAAQSGG